MKKYVHLILFCIALSSCGVYRQNVVNVPLMQQKGQAQAGGHISFNGYDAQASYAVTGTFGIMANYNDLGHRREDFSSKSYARHKHYFGEMGVGTYKQTRKEKTQEVFLLAGKGMTSHTVTNTDSAGSIRIKTQRVRYSRFLVQGDFGNTKKRLLCSISPRLFLIHYYDIKDDFRYDYRNLSNSFVYAEAAVTLRYRLYPFIRISAQACGTLPLTGGGGYNYYYEFSPFNYSLGLVFNLNLLKTNHKMAD